MKPRWLAACLLPAMLSLTSQIHAQDRARYEKMIAKHARANLVPEALVHRLIVRESKYNPELIGHGGTIGLMQLKLATAKGIGYTGDAHGLRDPETNLTWGIKYLAGAYRAAGGDYDRAIHYFAGGYYYVAKQQRLDHLKQGKPDLGAAPPKIALVADKRASPTKDTAQDDSAAPAESSKPEDAPAKPVGAPLKLGPARPMQAAAKPKTAKKTLADAKSPVPRPALPGGANTAHPR